jgi:hypothetical protein
LKVRGYKHNKLATSGNSSIRIQGLDGRYNNFKDGFPVYSGASSGLGLLQTPPLDFKASRNNKVQPLLYRWCRWISQFSFENSYRGKRIAIIN